MSKRIVGLSVILTLIICAIGALFWYQEGRYLLPTPVPKDYKVVLTNEVLRFDNELLSQKHTRPKLLHFFSPDCPCSRFNLKHFFSLKKKYQEEVDFYVVISRTESIEATKKMIDPDVPILIDTDRKLAKACGVYSTPQAVLIQTNNMLYFRGNYNRSRFCVDKKSNFVQMALDSLSLHKSAPHFSELATKSYGCSIAEDKSASILF
jgi:hypothetical protein